MRGGLDLDDGHDELQCSGSTPRALLVAYLLDVTIGCASCWAEMLVCTMDIQTCFGHNLDVMKGSCCF